MRKTRDTRLERQDMDWGDDDTEVHILDSHTAQCYHEDEDCPNLQRGSGVSSTTRAVAKRRWLAPCGACVSLQEVSEEVTA